MAALTIRNLDDDVKAKLRARAAKHGRSMEAEAREILTAAVGVSQPQQGDQEITIPGQASSRPDQDAQPADVAEFIRELPEINDVATAFIRMGQLLGGIELDIPPRTQKARIPDFARSELDEDDERAAS